MAAQTEIKPGKPKVIGIDATYSGLLRVEIPLHPRPDAHWERAFNQGSGASFNVSMHVPRVVGGVVQILPPDDKVEKYVTMVKERVEAANRYYAEHIEPRLRAQEEAETREKEERKRRVEEAQKRLDDAA